LLIKKADIFAVLSGMMATLAGIGLSRFAYTPLLPELVQQQWFSDSQAAYLGAGNLLGYLLGALSAHQLSERISIRILMIFCFISISLSFILCAQPGHFYWFFFWRLIAGIAGAILMVVGPANALSKTPVERRAGVGGFIFTGIGLGVVLSSSVVPLLMQVSLSATWLTLGCLTLLTGLLCDIAMVRLYNAAVPIALPTDLPKKGEAAFIDSGPLIIFVMAAYALDAVGFIPHTMFWVDYLAREQNLGTQAASAQWTIFGIGAICGPMIAGSFAHRMGWHSGLILAFFVKAIAVSIPILSTGLVGRTLSSFIVGAMVPGIVVLTSGRIAELIGSANHKRFWGMATVVFAISQALSGYIMSALYETWKSYYFLFYIASTALFTSTFLILVSDKVNKYNTKNYT
jgi:predicted MFS family arabinose efflux permease